jgi:integrase
MAKVLTARSVSQMKCTGTLPKEVPDQLAPGLHLVVYPSGKKSWALRFRRPDRRPAKLVLGSVSTAADTPRDPDPVVGGYLTLAAARRLAGALRHQIATGQDPAAAHQRRTVALSAENTFASAASDFVLQHARAKTRQWQRTARMLGLEPTGRNLPVGSSGPNGPVGSSGPNGPVGSSGTNVPEELQLIPRGLAARWRDLPVSEIDADVVFRLIEEVRHKGVPGLERRKNGEPSESMARSMHSALSKMFAWLLEKRRVAHNPLDALKRPSPPRARERVLSEKEIVAFWNAAGEASKPFEALFKLLLLTGCRLNEVARMEAGELNADRSIWVIPGARVKNHLAHVVCLPPLAREIIAGVERSEDCKYVLSISQRAPICGFGKAKRKLDALMQGVPPWRLHDLRRTAATHMGELGIPPHIIELCLNHISGAKAGVAGTYNRSVQLEERRAALQKWADRVAELVDHA